MIDHMLFNQAFWMKRTDDVKNKLSNYQNLQNQVNSLQLKLDAIPGIYYWTDNELEPTKHWGKITASFTGSGKLQLDLNVIGVPSRQMTFYHE